MNGWLIPLFAIVGLLMGGLINILADYLPARRMWDAPLFPHSWQNTLAVVRVARGADKASFKKKLRGVLVEIGTMILFAVLPAILYDPTNPLILPLHTLYLAVFILIIVIDLEHRLILDVVTYPTTAIAILISVFIQDDNYYTWKGAIVGAIIGYAVFLVFYFLGNKVFGAGALGFGDVKLSMMMGAMLGFHRIFFALFIGVFLAGVTALLLVFFGRRGWKSYIAYGPYLAIGGMYMLLWGTEVALNSGLINY